MGRRWVYAVVLTGLGIGAVDACSSFGSDSGSSGSAPDDAAVAAVDGADGPGSGVEAGFTPCKDRPQDLAHFCDDFDHQGIVDFNWKANKSTLGWFGETDAAASPARALLTGIHPGSSPQYVNLGNDRGSLVDVSTKNTIRVGLSLRVGKPPFPADASNGFVQVVSLVFDDPSCVTSGSNRQRQVEMLFEPGGNCYLNAKGLRDLCQDGGDFLSMKMPFQLQDFVSDRDYRRVTIEISRTACNGAGNASLKVAIDGAPDIPCASLGAGDPFAHATRTNLLLGPFAYVSTGTWAETEIAFDDVTVDLE